MALGIVAWIDRVLEVGMAQREFDEYDRLEEAHPDGVSAGQIVEFFAPKGVKLAQATFRKYVQLGLLPRSRRVGEKGKHRGSRGLYPASAARRIHLIKALMDEGMTLEDIRGSFIYFRGQLDGVERSLDELFVALDKSVTDKLELKPSRPQAVVGTVDVHDEPSAVAHQQCRRAGPARHRANARSPGPRVHCAATSSCRAASAFMRPACARALTCGSSCMRPSSRPSPTSPRRA